MSDGWKFFLQASAVVIAGIAVIAMLVNFAARYQCNNYERITGIETRWVTLDICYIKTETGWQRWDEYVARSVTNEGK